MLNNIYNYFYTKSSSVDIKIPPSNRNDTSLIKEQNNLLSSFNKQIIRSKINIEKSNLLKKDKEKIKKITNTLIDIFTKSNFMIKLLNKMKGNIHEKNNIYVYQMMNNLSELNNIFDLIYARCK